MSDDIRYKVETTLGVKPGEGVAISRLLPIEEQIARDVDGGFIAECPSCWSKNHGMVNTDNAQIREATPTLIRWQGVPCDKCDKTFTVEAELPPPEPK